MLHSVQIRRQEPDPSTHPAVSKDPVMIKGLHDGSDFSSGINQGEALHYIRFSCEDKERR